MYSAMTTKTTRKTFNLLLTLFLCCNSGFSAQLIIINGTSCCGKSSASKELLHLIKSSKEKETEKWEIESLDTHVITDFELQYGPITSAPAPLPPEYTPPYSKLIPHHAKFYDPFHLRISRKLKEGTNVILDHCFSKDENFKNALFHFQNEEVLFIKLSTDFDTATERLRQRNQGPVVENHRHIINLQHHFGKLPISSSQNSVCKYIGLPIYVDKIHDLEIDTTHLTTREIAIQIFEKMNQKDTFKKGAFFERHIATWNRPHEAKEFIKNCWMNRDTTPYWVDYDKISKFLKELDERV